MAFFFSVAAGLVSALLAVGPLKPWLDRLDMFRGRGAAASVIGGMALGLFLAASMFISWYRGKNRPKRGDTSPGEFRAANFSALLFFLIPALVLFPIRGDEINPVLMVFYMPYISFRDHLGFAQLSALLSAGLAGVFHSLCFAWGRWARTRDERLGREPRRYAGRG